jgi:hypothetical protein
MGPASMRGGGGGPPVPGPNIDCCGPLSFEHATGANAPVTAHATTTPQASALRIRDILAESAAGG